MEPTRLDVEKDTNAEHIEKQSSEHSSNAPAPVYDQGMIYATPR